MKSFLKNTPTASFIKEPSDTYLSGKKSAMPWSIVTKNLFFLVVKFPEKPPEISSFVATFAFKLTVVKRVLN